MLAAEQAEAHAVLSEMMSTTNHQRLPFPRSSHVSHAAEPLVIAKCHVRGGSLPETDGCLAVEWGLQRALPTPHSVRLLFWVNRSTQHAGEGNGDNCHVVTCWLSNTACILDGLSYEQVPENKRRAKYTRRPEHCLRCAPSLRRPLELLVSAPDILRRRERVLHQLINVRRLHAEVVRERRL